jgi:MFS family permease
MATVAPPLTTQQTVSPPPGLTKHLLVIFSIIFGEFLVMGISLGVLPSYVHQTLGYSDLLVGLVIGTQYVATLGTRHLAGTMADTRGGRRAVFTGVLLSVGAGVLCLLSLLLAASPALSLGCLLVGRALLGIGESFLVIGIFTWGFVLVGPQNTGKVMVWNGMGMHGGMACGAPLGLWLQAVAGLGLAFGVSVLLPLLSLGITYLLPTIPRLVQEARLPFYRAVTQVWKSGTGLALASIGFGGIASFITLYFSQQGWAHAPLALSAFGAGYIGMRLFFAHYPDKFGGAPVAMACLAIEVVGQLLIWLAPASGYAIAGAVLTGVGMSLVFPSFGQIAVRRVPAANRGMAMAAYNAFFDLGMGLTAPVAGLIAGGVHYDQIYLFGALAAAGGFSLAYLEYRQGKRALT